MPEDIERAARANPEDVDGRLSEEDERSSQKSYATILEQEIQEGLDELERPARGLLLSGASAGLDIGFSVLAIGALATLFRDESELVRTLLRANGYAIGFVLVILGRSELFTEHTTLAVLPLFDGRTQVGRVARLWALVYVGNLIGVTAFSAVLATVGPALGTVDASELEALAVHFVEPAWWVILASAVMAGWLMGLVSWLVTAARETIAQIFLVWVVTALIGLAGLHHCVVGSAELMSALFTGADLSLAVAARSLALTTLGNIIGGCVFVGVVKYGHSTATRAEMRGPSWWRQRSERASHDSEQ